MLSILQLVFSFLFLYSVFLLLVFQADILVSELLGSFGDNELSPECLDGAQTFLKSKYSRTSVHA